MTRSPDLPSGHRIRLPTGTVVYHASRLESFDDVIAGGLRPRKPAGRRGNYRWLGNRDELGPLEVAIREQPAGIYVGTELGEMFPYWTHAAGGTPCVWKINASGLTATADPAYPENPHILLLVGRVRPERLLALYDCSSGAPVSVSLANRA